VGTLKVEVRVPAPENPEAMWMSRARVEESEPLALNALVMVRAGRVTAEDRVPEPEKPDWM
jgi:hypothetical protein